MDGPLALSVSQLDTCRWWGQEDGHDPEVLLHRLESSPEPTPAMQLGTDVHWLLERWPKAQCPDTGILSRRMATENGPYWDLLDGTKTDVDLLVPDAVEVPISSRFKIDGEPLIITGRVDAISGLTIVDYKITTKSLGMKWQDSWQWRLYLAMVPGCRNFRYQALKVKETGQHEYTILDSMHWTIPRPGDLVRDILEDITPYVRWLRRLGWRKPVRRKS